MNECFGNYYNESLKLGNDLGLLKGLIDKTE